jgi:hypothetical protein
MGASRWATSRKKLQASGIRNKMTLKSALQDVKETTLAAVSGLLAKLKYLASLRRSPGGYEHWGMQSVHGTESSERALKSAHGEIVAGVLRTPLGSLTQDLRESSQASGITPQAYIEALRENFDDLLPGERKDTPEACHLNSVLLALSSLEKSRGRATRSTS